MGSETLPSAFHLALDPSKPSPSSCSSRCWQSPSPGPASKVEGAGEAVCQKASLSVVWLSLSQNTFPTWERGSPWCAVLFTCCKLTQTSGSGITCSGFQPTGVLVHLQQVSAVRAVFLPMYTSLTARAIPTSPTSPYNTEQTLSFKLPLSLSPPKILNFHFWKCY